MFLISGIFVASHLGCVSVQDLDPPKCAFAVYKDQHMYVIKCYSKSGVPYSSINNTITIPPPATLPS